MFKYKLKPIYEIIQLEIKIENVPLNEKGLLNNEKWIKHASFVKGKLSVLYNL